jgi:hypothetical protein
MCRAAVAYRTLFTVSTPGYDNVELWQLTDSQNQTFYCFQNSVFFTTRFDRTWPSSGNTQDLQITGDEVSSSITFYILPHMQNEIAFIFMSLYVATVVPSIP